MSVSFDGWRVTALCRPTYSFGHNLRLPSYVASQKHIDSSRPHKVLLHMGDERETYEKIFGESIKEYNKNQKRKDRRIGDYYQKILDDERKGKHKSAKADGERKPFYEFQFYIGNRDSHCPDKITEKVLTIYIQKIFPKRFPNFIPTSIVVHNDEFSFDRNGNRLESPLHFHVVGVFVAHALTMQELKQEMEYRKQCKEKKKVELESKGIEWIESEWKKKVWRGEMISRWGKSLEKGMLLQSSMSAACNEMGYFTSKGKGTAQQQFEEAVRHDIMDFAESIGIKINRTKGYSHSHKEKEIYIQEQNIVEKEIELQEKQSLLEAKELDLQNRTDDFDYKIEKLEELETVLSEKSSNLKSLEKSLQIRKKQMDMYAKEIQSQEMNLQEIKESTKRIELLAKKEYEESKRNKENAIWAKDQAERMYTRNQELLDSYHAENRAREKEIANWNAAAKEIHDGEKWLNIAFTDYYKNKHKDDALRALYKKVIDGMKSIVVKVKQTYDNAIEDLTKKLFGYTKFYKKNGKLICEYSYGESDYADMLRDTPIADIQKAIDETKSRGKNTFAEAAQETGGFAFYERNFEKAKILTRERKLEIARQKKNAFLR